MKTNNHSIEDSKFSIQIDFNYIDYQLILIPERLSARKFHFLISQNLSIEEKPFIEKAYKKNAEKIYMLQKLSENEKLHLREILEKIRYPDFISVYLGNLINEDEHREIKEKIFQEAVAFINNENISIVSLFQLDKIMVEKALPILAEKFNHILTDMFTAHNERMNRNYWNVFTGEKGLIPRFIRNTLAGKNNPELKGNIGSVYHEHVNDLVQTVIAKLVRAGLDEKLKIRNFDGLCGYCLKTVRSVVYDFLAKRKKENDVFHSVTTDIEKMHNDRDYESQQEQCDEMIKKLHNFLASRNIHENLQVYTDIFLFDRILKISNQDIAEIMKISLATLGRYKQKLRGNGIPLPVNLKALDEFVTIEYEKKNENFRNYLQKLREKMRIQGLLR